MRRPMLIGLVKSIALLIRFMRACVELNKWKTEQHDSKLS